MREGQEKRERERQINGVNPRSSVISVASSSSSSSASCCDYLSLPSGLSFFSLPIVVVHVVVVARVVVVFAACSFVLESLFC